MSTSSVARHARHAAVDGLGEGDRRRDRRLPGQPEPARDRPGGALSDAGMDFSGSARAGAGTVTAGGHLEWRDLAALRQVSPAGQQPAGRRRPGSADRRLARSRLQPSTAARSRSRARYGAVRENQPKDITNAVRASPDEVIVGSEPEDADQALRGRQHHHAGARRSRQPRCLGAHGAPHRQHHRPQRLRRHHARQQASCRWRRANTRAYARRLDIQRRAG